MHVLLALLIFAAAPPPRTIQIHHVAWHDGAPPLPRGTKVAILEGDPKLPGIFTMRLVVPPGSSIYPHWHPRDERVTVISGEVQVGFGDRFISRGMTKFTQDDFYVNPAESHHYVFFPSKTVLQITGEGPWEIHLLK
jgi:hypothetical protein